MRLNVNMNLFSDNDCRKVLKAPNGTIKSPNFPLPYPDNSSCVWIVTLEQEMYIDIEVVALDLPPASETLMNYLKLRLCGYPELFYRDDKRKLPIERLFPCKSFIVEFKTGENNNENYGFLLNYWPSEFLKTSVASNESDKSASLNTKRM